MGGGYGYGGASNDVDPSYQQWMMGKFSGGNQGPGYGVYPGVQKPNPGYVGNWDYLFKGNGLNNNGYFGNIGKGVGGYQGAGVDNGYGNDNDGYFNAGNNGYGSGKSSSSGNGGNSDDSSSSSKGSSNANDAY